MAVKNPSLRFPIAVQLDAVVEDVVMLYVTITQSPTKNLLLVSTLCASPL
jgi:hypothetical protein